MAGTRRAAWPDFEPAVQKLHTLCNPTYQVDEDNMLVCFLEHKVEALMTRARDSHLSKIEDPWAQQLKITTVVLLDRRGGCAACKHVDGVEALTDRISRHTLRWKRRTRWCACSSTRWSH